MAYNANIPQPGDVKSQSQPQLLGNFQAINTAFTVNHVAFDLADQGKHKFITMPVQGAAPAFGAGENGFYNLNNATTTKNELYVQHQWNAGAVATAFTASKMSNTAAAGCVNGWAYLPCGLLVKWGQTAAPAPVTSVAITPTATAGGPAFTQAFRTYVSGYQTAGLTNFTCGETGTLNVNGNFTAYCNNSAANTFINWLVIGV